MATTEIDCATKDYWEVKEYVEVVEAFHMMCRFYMPHVDGYSPEEVRHDRDRRDAAAQAYAHRFIKDFKQQRGIHAIPIDKADVFLHEAMRVPRNHESKDLVVRKLCKLAGKVIDGHLTMQKAKQNVPAIGSLQS